MMRTLLGLSFALLGFVLFAAPAPKGNASAARKKTTTSKTSSAKTGVRKASTSAKAPAKTAKKGASRKGSQQVARGSSKSATTRRASSSSRRRRASIPSFRAGQQHPTPDRIKDIQSALIARGYMQGEADGAWSASTVDALKRFQQDQNLNADGKLTSMSLIALGLGPKRSGLASAPKPATVPAPAPPEEFTPPALPSPAPAELPPAPLTLQEKEPQ